MSVQRVVDCSAPPAAIWRIVADTNRMNQAMGLSPLQVTPIGDAGAARFLIKARVGAITLEYEELPFEWIAGERQVVRRRMKRGPVKDFLLDTRIEPRGGGARVTFALTLKVSPGILAPLIALQARMSLGKYAEVVEKLDGTEDPWEHAAERIPRTRTHEVGSGFARAAAALRDVVGEGDRPIAERLTGWLAGAPDIDVTRIRPYELADDWGTGRRQMLGVCLHAVGAGLLELSWDLVCPSCRTASAQHAALTDFAQHGTCNLCDLEFSVDFDGAVEATFRPASSARQVVTQPFCMGGAARTPHVAVQQLLPAGGQTTLQMPREAGTWRLFVRGGETATVHIVDGEASEATLDLAPLPDPPPAARGEGVDAHPPPSPAEGEPGGGEPAHPPPPPAQRGEGQGGGQGAPQEITLAPGAKLHVTQPPTAPERHLKLERPEWRRQAATAQDLSLMPAFRDRFSGEALRAGVALRVARTAILFSDLTGSTALYRRAGDAVAFRVITDHFALLSHHIEQAGGVVIKTIGDAVMAAFSDDEAAVRAASALLVAYPRFRSATPDAATTDLKLGIHAGSCYAVTANGVLDYFGQTVNLAARLQALAHAGELILPAPTWATAAAEHWADGLALAETLSVVLKGLEEPTPAVRLRRAA